jgi:hypothetical protein
MKAHYHEASPEASGYLIGGCIMPFLVSGIFVWIYTKSRPGKLSSSAKMFAFSLGAALFALLSSSASLINARNADKALATHVGHLAKEAVGQAPASPDESVWDSVTRSFFVDVKAFNDQYVKELASVDMSVFSKLFTTKSFATRPEMLHIVSQLQTVRDLDGRHKSMEPILEKVRARVQALDVSDLEKDGFLKGFEETAQKNLAMRTETIEKEMAWIAAALDLYQFMLDNENLYYVNGNKVIFPRDSGLLQQFNDKLHKATSLRKDSTNQAKVFKEEQTRRLSQFGLTPSDMGLPPQKKLKAQ